MAQSSTSSACFTTTLEQASRILDGLGIKIPLLTCCAASEEVTAGHAGGMYKELVWICHVKPCNFHISLRLVGDSGAHRCTSSIAPLYMLDTDGLIAFTKDLRHHTLRHHILLQHRRHRSSSAATLYMLT